MLSGDQLARQCAKPKGDVKLNGGSVRVKDDGENSDVRCLFYRVLAVYLNVCCDGLPRPLPPVVGVDRQYVDLFRLFMAVRENGGFEVVQGKKLWESVAEECRLSLGSPDDLVSVYEKYLLELENRVRGFSEGHSMGDLRKCLMELEIEFSGISSEGGKMGSILLDAKEEGCSLGGVECKLNTEDFEGLFDCVDVEEDVGKVGGGKKIGDVGEILVSHKGKRVSLSGEGDKENEVHKMGSIILDAKEEGCSLGDVECKLNTEDFGEFFDCVNVRKDVGKLVGGKKIGDGGEILISHKGKRVSLSGEGDKDNEEIFVYPIQAEDTTSRKRKRDSLVELLNWLKMVAKNPFDARVGSIPEISGWKASENEYRKQILLFRESVFIKLRNGPSSCQTFRRMSPSMYNDRACVSPRTSRSKNNISRGKKNISKGKKNVVTGRSRSGAKSESFSGAQIDLKKSTAKASQVDMQSRENLGSSSANSDFKYPAEKVPIGTFYQAEIPECSGLVSGSDSKWLGTRVWPMENVESRLIIEKDPTENGRQDNCDCPFAGSIDCVRFHITENRLKLIGELGSAFFIWKFDSMGDEVRLSWTKEEESMFKGIVKRNLSAERPFWDEVYQKFPSRSWKVLVSYYFNVFVRDQRAYQNRHTPTEINSDDDAEIV